MEFWNTHHSEDSRIGIVILGLQECQEIAYSEVSHHNLKMLDEHLSLMKRHVEYMLNHFRQNISRTDMKSIR